MEYKYPPLYKYIAFFIILFLFLRFYKQITPDRYLVISILVTLLIIAIDYMVISNQPPLLSISENFDQDDLAGILEDEDEDEELGTITKVNQGAIFEKND